MAQNLEALRQAAVIYPIFAVLFTVPYLLYCYRKYGSVLSLRIVIVYSFALYLLCVYCLVILPLPSAEKARTLSGRKQQWIPFWFVRNMLGEAKPVWNQPKSWLRMLNTGAFLTTALNVLMTLPFGIYLRYYFQCSLKKTLFASFLLSLFFELTQLSGLYFIYPGSYRLFDVDDLMTNTLGGVLGYALAGPLTRWLPSRETLDQISAARSERVSLLRRLLALGVDLFVAAIFETALYIGSRQTPFGLGMIACFVLSAWIGRGRTPGYAITRLRLAREDGSRPRVYQYLVRYVSMYAVLIALPAALNVALVLADGVLFLSPMAALILLGVVDGGYLFGLLFELIRAAMRRPLFYERLSRTRLVSTLPVPEKK